MSSGAAANTMGGGRPILTFIRTCAMVGIGTTLTNAKRIIPKSNLFIFLPPANMIVFSAFLDRCITLAPISKRSSSDLRSQAKVLPHRTLEATRPYESSYAK